MAFPSSVPSYTGFTSTHTLSQDQHASQHNAEQADITAIATKVGTGASTPAINTVLRGNGTGTTTYDQVHLASDVSGILSATNGGTGQSGLTSLPLVTPSISGGGSWTGGPTLSGPVIADFTSANHNHQNTAGGGTLNGGTALQSASITGDRLVNDTVTPAKMLGIDMYGVSSALSGVSPSAGTGQFYIQAGTNVLTVNAGGDGTLIFPTSFPTGLVSVVANNGTTGNNPITIWDSGNSAAVFNFRCQGASNATIRIDWIAIGF